MLSREVHTEVRMGMGVESHENCDDNSPKSSMGPNGQVHDAEQEVVCDGTFSRWLMVACKRNGTRA